MAKSKLDTAEITWDEGATRWKDLGTSKRELLDKNGFYGILLARFDPEAKTWKDCELHYVGMSFDQTLRQRLLKPHDADPCIDSQVKSNPGSERVVMVGGLTRISLEKVTWDLVKDIECCLIFTNQPTCNSKCKDSYTGREIQVVNRGDFAPLKETSRCPVEESPQGAQAV